MDLKASWKAHYRVAEAQLGKLKEVRGVASVFNANIDAVLKVKADRFQDWMQSLGLDEWQVLNMEKRRIEEGADLLRGFLECFSKGIAQEWLVTRPEAFAWMQATLGYDRHQMGGQGGIIANVMAVCGVQQVYVHCASHPEEQAELFLDRANLLAADRAGNFCRAHELNREGDKPLIHWILEFDKGDEIQIGGLSQRCPKSNRFIATYDPLNFELYVDPGFHKALQNAEQPLDYILLSGYQMLSEEMQGGRKGVERIESSWAQVEAWKAAHPHCLVHFEFASTQDLGIRKALARQLAPRADSVGCNEQEEIQILEGLGEAALARACAQSLDSVNLFKGLLKIFQELGLKRIQLHMFGLYVTLLGEDWQGGDLEARQGMILAAVLAAAKAGTGSLEKEEGLLWAKDHDVAEHSLKELKALAAHLKEAYQVQAFEESGIADLGAFRVVAIPTILVEKPVTLVGMGDTISSLSLVAAR